MSNSIDERIVSMKLNNSQFEANAKQTLGTLGTLAKGLKLDNAAKGLENVGAAAKNMNLSTIAQGVDSIASKFNSLSIIGITALSTIANKAVNVGLQMAKSLTIDPIKSGLDEYETNLNSIQTILANTGLKGSKGLAQVNKSLDELNTYSDQTIYNFSEMARNIGTFTSAGVKLGPATQAIKGIANLAAVSGSSADQASTAMYQLSQAMASGSVKLQDWNSVVNAGMGGKVFQESLKETARVHGIAVDKIIKDEGSFRDSLHTGWLSSQVMSETLAKFTGDLSAAQLKQMGYSKKQIAQIIEMGKTAKLAATQVKTGTQLVGTLQEAVGSGWSMTWRTIIGDFNEAPKLWTNVNNVLGGMISASANARNKLLGDWKALGGRTVLIEALGNAFKALMSIINPIKDAFKQVFPPATGKQLYDMTVALRNFTKGLILGGPAAENLKKTFAGIFSIFKIGWTIIKGVFSTLANLFGIAQGGAGGFLALTGAVGDFIVKIQEWLVNSGKIQGFFNIINTARAAVLVPLISVVGKIASAFGLLLHGDVTGFVNGIKGAFSGLGDLANGVWKSMTGSFTGLIEKLQDAAGIAGEFLKTLGIGALKPLQEGLAKLSENFGKLKAIISDFGFDLFNKGAAGASATMNGMSDAGKRIQAIWTSIRSAFEKVKGILAPVSDSIGNLFKTITDKLAEYVKGLDMQDAVALLNTGFFILMYKSIKDFMKKMGEIGDSFKGIAESISGTFDKLTETLSTMQQNVKANIILKIAFAVGILAGSLYLLSTIEPAKLAMSLGAIAVMMVLLTKTMGSMLSMTKVIEGQAPQSAGKLLAAGGALVLVAGAILLLSSAVKKLSGLNFGELTKGLIGVGALLGALSLFTKFANLQNASMKGAASLVLMAGAIYLLSFSVSKLGNMDTGALVQGGVAVAAMLAMMAGVSKVMGNPQALAGAGGVLALAGALAVLAPVIMGLGLIPYETLGKGLGTIAIALGLLAAASIVMGNPEALAGAAGVLALAGSLMMLTPVILALGMADFSTLAKGLGAIAIALTLLAAASIVMGNPLALAGAVGVLAMAAALQMLTPVILILGNADLKTLAIGLGAIAVGFAILIAAGAAAMAVAPGLEALGLAVIMLGGGMALAGIGMAAFALGFATLAAVGTAGFAVLTTGFMGLINLIPLIAEQIGLGLRAIAVVITNSGPQIIGAITTVLIAFLKAIQNASPQFFSTMATLIIGLVNTVSRIAPQIYDAGARMILGFLQVLKIRVPQFASAAVDLMLAFLGAISKNVQKIVDAGAKMIVDLVNGIANSIRSNSTALGQAGGNLASAIIDGMVNGLGAGTGVVLNKIGSLAQSALDKAKSILGIHSPSREFYKIGQYVNDGFRKGLDGNKSQVTSAFDYLRKQLSDSMLTSQKSVESLEAKLKKLTSARHKDRAAIQATAKALSQARSEHAKETAAYIELTKRQTAAKNKLTSLAAQQDAVAERLKKANQTLADAKKARDDFAASITDQYDKLPSVEKDTKLPEFVKSMEKQVADTQIFTAQLQQLRKMGLNDAMYKELLSKGLDAMPFAQQLLEGGQVAVNQVNTLGSALDKAAKSLGSSASTALYQAAVDSAAGLVKGLEAQQANIEKQMDKIADAMVKAIKKKLGIKSPSREFMKVGDWSVQGLTKGLERSSSASEAAAEKVGHQTIDSLRKTLTGLSDVVATHVDVDPTIRPVLDLTAVKKDAGQIGSLLSGDSISVGSAFAQAKAAASDYSANQASREQMAMAGAGTNLSFTQNNYSPKALSDATIYRQTKNQISTAKGALKN